MLNPFKLYRKFTFDVFFRNRMRRGFSHMGRADWDLTPEDFLMLMLRGKEETSTIFLNIRNRSIKCIERDRVKSKIMKVIKK